MTAGEIYRNNKELYDSEALTYIDRHLINKGSLAHRPFELMTHYSRVVCEKITDEYYLVFTAYVKDIIYKEFRDIESYVGVKDNAKIYTKKELVRMFAFEISQNPRSASNLIINPKLHPRGMSLCDDCEDPKICESEPYYCLKDCRN